MSARGPSIALAVAGAGGVLWAIAAVHDGAYAEMLACLTIATGAFLASSASARGAALASAAGFALMAGGSLAPLLPALGSMSPTHPAIVMTVGFALAALVAARSARGAAFGLLLAAIGGFGYVRGDFAAPSWWTPGNALMALGLAAAAWLILRMGAARPDAASA